MFQVLTLVSHNLCPYVQRAAILLTEKRVPFERCYVDLACPPAWFSAISPLEKVPVLLVGDRPIFESAVICEYLDETIGPRLHPADPLERAHHRSWMEFGSNLLDNIWRFYSAADERAMVRSADELAAKALQIEAELEAGPYFAGTHFSIVDAVFGPIFRYFDVFDAVADFGVFRHTPKVRAWRQALSTRDSVLAAVSPDYPERLREFLLARDSALARRMRHKYELES
ncbi:MAG: glutathione S-transferase family protein [Gammaproteobacteria bacterium]|nr:glutathione S-transferase family protein [Gammaproteobacteria bacterium]